MKARNGQIALYLVMVLLVIAVLMLVNVNAFLAVRSKNRMMNAVDEAALAVAKYQGHLLNEVGRKNVAHLRAAVLGESLDENGVASWADLRELTFLGPVEGIRISNEVAADWGYESGSEPRALSGFRDHISEILNNPDLYPPLENGVNLWHVYAERLGAELAGNPAVLPGYMEIVNPGSTGLFANHGFYDVLAAKAWCWFTIGGNRGYLDQDPAQIEPFEMFPVEVPENSEVYSLHVTYKTWMDSGWAEHYDSGKGAFDAEWTNFVCQVTGLEPGDFSPRSYAADPAQVWAFYDDLWRTWSVTYNPDNFPIAGTVRPEYDVAGCLASCMMLAEIPQMAVLAGDEEKAHPILVTAEAKPLGTVRGTDGGILPVTGYNRFIAASSPGEQIFTEANLVLVGSVPRSPGVSMEPGWYDHVKKHSPRSPSPGCPYCKLWTEWSDPSFRASIRSWLQQNSDSCRSKGGSGPVEKGGYPYAH